MGRHRVPGLTPESQYVDSIPHAYPLRKDYICLAPGGFPEPISMHASPVSSFFDSVALERTGRPCTLRYCTAFLSWGLFPTNHIESNLFGDG